MRPIITLWPPQVLEKDTTSLVISAVAPQDMEDKVKLPDQPWIYFLVRVISLFGPRRGFLRHGQRFLVGSSQVTVMSLIIGVPFHCNSPDNFFGNTLPGGPHPPPKPQAGILMQLS
jgi:hypothetical protein